jgi:cytochrome c-type biogenesis protein CcmE
MKLSHIIGIVVIAAAIAIIASTSVNTSTYVSFKEAAEMAKAGEQDEVHVVGKLKKDGVGQIVGMQYRPEIDPNRFSFILVDNNHEERTVVYDKPKPQDFEKSEQVVLIGQMKGQVFHAKNILMKCPSKYQEEGRFQEPGPRQAGL